MASAGGRLTVEAAVVGGGPAGLTAAIALAQAGIATALIAPPPAGDNRTTALLAGSVTALETLGIWPRCEAQAAPQGDADRGRDRPPDPRPGGEFRCRGDWPRCVRLQHR